MLVWLLASAFAQDVPQVNGQLFRPAIGSRTTLWTETTTTAPDGYGSARAFFHYANRPLRVDGGEQVLVNDVAELDLAGSYTFRSLRMGAHLPLYAWTAGPQTTDQPGVGDLLVDLQGQVLDGTQAPIGLAIAGRLILPTSSVEAPLGGGATGWELAGIVDRRFGDVTVAANVGTRGVPLASYGDTVWNDAFFVRGGAGWAVTERAGLSGELGAQTNWSSGDYPAGTAAELVAGGWLGVADELVLRGGASAGLGHAPGTPVARLLLGLSWEPDMYPDRDADGLVDRDDWCPDEPEDVDGFDDGDGCLDRTTTVVFALTEVDGQTLGDAHVRLDGPETHELSGDERMVTLHPGTYQLTIEADGHETLREELVVKDEPGRVISRPLVAHVGSLRVWAVDTHGAAVDAQFTVSGSDPWPADGTPVEVAAGEHALVITSAGYEAQAVSLHVDHGQGREYSAVLHGGTAKAPVRMTSDRIEIDEQVHFDLNKASIAKDSWPLLDRVAALILQHPEVSRVRIEGHTDDQGPKGFNQRLSEERADAVRRYLIGKGVDPSRLRSVGFGPARPLKPGDSEADKAANRRVEFHLES